MPSFHRPVQNSPPDALGEDDQYRSGYTRALLCFVKTGGRPSRITLVTACRTRRNSPRLIIDRQPKSWLPHQARKAECAERRTCLLPGWCCNTSAGFRRLRSVWRFTAVRGVTAPRWSWLSGGVPSAISELPTPERFGSGLARRVTKNKAGVRNSWAGSGISSIPAWSTKSFALSAKRCYYRDNATPQACATKTGAGLAGGNY